MTEIITADQALGLPQRTEFALSADENKAMDSLPPDEMRQALDDLRARQTKLETQNKELRRTHAELETALARYYDLYDLAPVGYFTLNDQGVILGANLTAASLFGVARGDLVERPLANFVLPEDRDIHYAHCQRIFATGAPQTSELRMLHADVPFWARLDAIATQDANGAAVCHVVASDISEHKLVEEALRQSEAKYELERKHRAILDQSYGLIGLTTPDGTLIEANRAALEIAGVKECDIRGKPFWETPWWTHSPETQDRLRDAVKAAASGESVRFETTHQTSDGELRCIDFSLTPIRDESGKITLLVAEGRDVTDRKRAERAVSRASEWERTFDAVPDLVALMDTNHRIVQVNRAMAERLGCAPEQLVGVHCCEAIHGLSEPPDFCPHKRMMASGKEECLELAIDRLKGVFEVRASPLHDESGQLVGCVHIARDVTARKEAEEALERSEERYRMLFSEATDGICVADVKTGKILDCNAALTDLIGRTREDIIGQRQTILHPSANDGELLSPEFRTHLGGPPGRLIEAQVVRSDGKIRTVEIKASNFNLRGRLVAIGVFRDVTDRKRADEALRESDRRLKEAEAMAHLGYWQWNVRTGDVEWSDEVFKTFNLDPNTFTPRIDSIMALSPWPEDRNRDKDLIQRAIDSHEPGEYDQRFLLPDGSVGYYHSTFQGRYDDQGNLLFIVGTVLNVTERKRAEAELIESNRQLEQATAKATEMAAKAEAASVAKSQFLATMSHELRTPLNAVIGFSEGLLGRTDFHPLNEHQQDRLRKIRASGYHLLHLINGILDMSKVEAGTIELQITTFDVEPVVREVGEMTDVLIEERSGVRFSVDMPEHLPQMTSDRDKVRQILINLLANAAKFTYAGSVVLHVRPSDDSITFSVEDTGIGVSMEHLQHLFDAFFQVKQKARPSQGGTGLGLSIAKALATMLGGSLTVESALEKGSTFALTVPLECVSANPMATSQHQKDVTQEPRQEIGTC
jgi:PAS domain S-box-containing protein